MVELLCENKYKILLTVFAKKLYRKYLKRKRKKNFGPFLGIGFNCLEAVEQLRGDIRVLFIQLLRFFMIFFVKIRHSKQAENVF